MHATLQTRHMPASMDEESQYARAHTETMQQMCHNKQYKKHRCKVSYRPSFFLHQSYEKVFSKLAAISSCGLRKGTPSSALSEVTGMSVTRVINEPAKPHMSQSALSSPFQHQLRKSTLNLIGGAFITH